MRKIRQYNDTAVQWSLLVKGTGEPFTLEGKTIRLFLKSLFATTEIEDFTIAGNTIGWVYKGEKQEHTGVYTLVVSVVDAQGVMVTTDTCDFVEIVDCTCKVGGNDPAGVKTETIELTSVVEVGAVSADLSAYLTKIEAANTYQRQEQGKGLSTNDYTDAEKARLNTLEQDVQQLKEQGVADLSDYLTKDEFNERIEGYATHDSVQELSENVTELSAEVGKKQDTITDLATIREGAAKGATAIQEVKTINGQPIVGSGNIEIQGGGGASNEWKCIYDGRLEAGKSSIIYATYADGTPLKAREAIIEVINDIKTVADITGYVRITSTLNKNKCSFGIITYESASVGDGKIMVQDVRIETSEHFLTKAYIAKDMKNSIAHGIGIQEQIGHNPQIFEDIVSIELASNQLLTEAAPLVKIYAR